MRDDVFAVADRLSEVIGNMQKCLQCTICLHSISDPMKTICGHRFCRPCIQKVLQKKNALCPLCNTAIQRRSVTTDEHMALYIERLDKLIEAVQMDSGIDIRSHLSRPRAAVESASNDMQFNKPDGELVEAGCSHGDALSSKKQSGSRSTRATQKQTAPARSKRGKKKKNVEREGSSITKFLSKCGTISGVERLPPDEMNELEEERSTEIERSTEERVHSWLENLPGIEALEDPNRIAPIRPVTECSLDDTSTISVSQSGNENKSANIERDNDGAAETAEPGGIHRSMSRRTSRRSLRNETKREILGNDRGFGGKGSASEIAKRGETKMDVDTENPKPSTSAFAGSSNENRERSQERSSDVHRTSPCDLLPTMKQNWSSVKAFGKEMRSRRKKLRSLNVSIENKGRSMNRGTEEPAVNKGEIGQRKVTRETSRGGARKESGTPDNVADKFAGRESSGGKEDSVDEKESRSRSKERSMSEEFQAPGDSAFIVLEEGEHVHISSLNNRQMNDIIGIRECNRPNEIDRRDGNNSQRERGDPSVASDRDRSGMVAQSTPAKAAGYEEPNNLRGNASSDREQNNSTGSGDRDELRSSSKLETSTPHSKRLSLKRHSDAKSCNTSGPEATARDRLQSVRRDLNREIDPSHEENGDGPGEDRYEGRKKQEDERVKRIACVQDESVSRKEESRRQGRSVVAFKKLGKIYKRRETRVKFLYLGTTKRRSLPGHTLPPLRLQKPCNPVDIVDTHESELANQLDNGFGNSIRITVNHTQSPRMEREAGEVVSEKEPVLESPWKINERSSNEVQATTTEPSTSRRLAEMAKCSEAKSQTSDVLFVALDEDKRSMFQPPRPRTPVKETLRANTIKMLSPTKDSQLQFLSLESPTVEHLRTQRATERARESEDVGSIEVEETLARVSQQGPHGPRTVCTPRKRRRRSESREKLSQRTEERDEGNRMRLSAHSFTSQATRVERSEKEFLPAGPEDTMGRSNSSSTKDIDTVSLSSDTDIVASVEAPPRKVYQRILPADSSDASSAAIACANKPANDQPGRGAAGKRKRAVSPDSDLEEDLNAIVSTWFEDAKPGDRLRKKGRLEGTRNSLNPVNVTRETRNDSSSGCCLTELDRDVNKQAGLQEARSRRRRRRQQADFTETKQRQVTNGGTVSEDEEDSAEFVSMIDRIKDLQNKTIMCDGKQEGDRMESLMQDNFDDVIANVVTETLIDDFRAGKELFDIETVSSGCFNRDDSRMDPSTNVPASAKDVSLGGHSNCSDKENECKESAPLYDDDDDDRTLTPKYVINVAKKMSKGDQVAGKTRPIKLTSKMDASRSGLNKSSLDTSAFPIDGNKLAPNENLPNYQIGKDSPEQDSLMNITQHYLMIKQFEEDLFGKAKDSGDIRRETDRSKQGPRSPEKKRKEGSSGVNAEARSVLSNIQDVEHSAEEEDIVENTPNTKKTKSRNNLPADSRREDGSAVSTDSPRIREKILPGKKVQPLHQSTPKRGSSASRKGCDSAAKTIISSINGSFGETTEMANVRNVSEKAVREKLRFVCSGLLAPQIEQVKRLCAAVNATYVAQFDREVTHVIVVTSKENNGANKTLKYLQGIAHRKWIVSYQWVLDSLREQRLIDEEPYEAVDCRTLEAGPRNSRLRERGLFEGFVFLCIGPYSNVSVQQYQDLLRATGGTVMDSLGALAAEKNKYKIIVIQADIYGYEVIEWYKKARAIPIVHDWVVECISQYKVISLYPYLQELTRQDVLALGYPEYLVEEYLDDGSDSMDDESA